MAQLNNVVHDKCHVDPVASMVENYLPSRGREMGMHPPKKLRAKYVFIQILDKCS